MSTATAHPMRVAAGFGLAAVLGAALATAARGPDGAPEGEVVTPRVLATALESRPPESPTMSDDIAHFRARLAARGDESFSRRRLVGAHLLRFRAYGDHADLEAADAHLDALQAASPDDPGALSLRASLHLARHEFRAARRVAREAVATEGYYDSALQLRLFDVLWAWGAYDEAAGLLELPHDTASIDHLAREARVLDRMGYVERARDRMRRVLDKVRAYAEPPAVEAWALVELGHFEHHSGDPHRAAALFLEALRVLPGSPAALEALAGLARGVDRNPEAALALYRQALNHGGHPDLVTVLAGLEARRGAGEEAAALLAELEARAASDELVGRWALRPLALALADDPATVCRALVHARRDLADRRDAGAWDALAWTLYHTGDVEAAYEASLEATAWGVPEPGVAYRAGVVAAARGDGDRANTMLRGALEGRSELTAAEVRDVERRLAGWEPEGRPAEVGCG